MLQYAFGPCEGKEPPTDDIQASEHTVCVPEKNVVTKWTFEYCTIFTGHKVVIIIIIIVFSTCDLKTQKFFLACEPYPTGTDQICQTSQKLFLSVPALSCWSAHQNFLVATSFSLASYFKLKIKII